MSNPSDVPPIIYNVGPETAALLDKLESLALELRVISGHARRPSNFITPVVEDRLSRLIPIELVGFTNAAVTANTNIFGGGAAPPNTAIVPASLSPSVARITGAFLLTGILSVVNLDGAGGVTPLNGNVALAAKSLYSFDVPWRYRDGINLQYSVSTTAMVLRVDEVDTAGP